jgi:hypothetical protein
LHVDDRVQHGHESVERRPPEDVTILQKSRRKRQRRSVAESAFI